MGAHLLKDAAGCYFDTRKTLIRTLKMRIDDATNCWLWRRHAKGTAGEAAFANGACSDIVRELVDRSSSLDKEHRHALHSAATGGQWTQLRHMQAGHDTSDLCQLCLIAPGTEWHRVLDCPVTEPQRTIHLDLEVQRAAMGHACAQHDRWTRGHLPKSAYPEPPKQSFGNKIMWWNGVEGAFLHEAFLDGSASHPANLGYSASACSIVSMEMVQERPRLQLRVDIALDDGIDGPEAAEISAVEFLLRFAVLPITAWSDCGNVVDAFSRGREYCTSIEHPFCIYWRRVYALLVDHGRPDGLVIKKIKAHCTVRNFGHHDMTYIQWAGNRHADKGAQSTARCMAEELNLQGYVDDCTRIEKDHRGLCLWIARVTAIVNRPDWRDAIPTPDDYTGTARKRLPLVTFGSKPCKRTPVVTTAAARTLGNPAAMDIVDIIPTGTYSQIRTFDLEQELEAVMSDSSSASSDFDLVRELEAIMSDDGGGSSDHADFVPANLSDVDFDWGDGAFEAVAPDTKRRRLIGKTSPVHAAALGYDLLDLASYSMELAPDADDASSDSDRSLRDDEIPTETSDVPSKVLDNHGGLFLRTDNILWCAKCGASAKIGWFSIYLRKPCPGKPVNDSMKQRRKRLIRGVHPTTCKLLVSHAKRVRIV